VAARVAAPLAFLVLATLGIVAVREALNESPSTRPATTTTVETAPTTEPAETETAPRTTAEGTFYRVRAGDTLESIAAQSGTSVEELLELNPGIDPVALRIGQRIRVG
jgi:LysM repeat protein